MASSTQTSRVLQTATDRGDGWLELSRPTRLLFLLFATYLVVPVVDVPILGLSLSAPILFLVFLEVFLGVRRTKVSQSRWVVISYGLLGGFLLSLAGNAIFRGEQIGSSDLVVLVQYGYWLIAFFTTAVLVASSRDLLPTLAPVLATAIVALACIRLYEAVVFGRWGAWTNPVLMSQNSYAIQFSMFAPYVVALAFSWRGRRQRLAIGAVVVLVITIAGNGSRSSWIATAVGTTLFLFIYAFTQRARIGVTASRLSMIIGVVALLALIAPNNVLEPVIERLETFETLSSDKSFAIRELMVQKGLRLFEDSPLFGAGLGRFRSASVPLDIPATLSYAGQDHFDIKSAHNSYIALLGETGLVGIVPFAILHMLLFFGGLSAAIRLARRGQIWDLQS